ncbi:unnamed protein product [Phyllotreta striolata]|uniref:Cytochrome P450 n=1 Tax=Phyllotreta striolata TaxID=444603 RepID=A0A9N9TPY0_PHYSR|nr:unnamed protein product [Phyllotreta striolata]
MKMMFERVLECTTGLEEMLKERSVAVDIKDILCRFTTDVIGSVAFGLEFNSMKDANIKLRKYGDYTFENSWRKRFSIFLENTFPTRFINIVNEVGFSSRKKEIETYFVDMIRKTVDYREKNNVFRKDALHLLIQLKNTGRVLGDEEAALKGDNENVTGGITMNELAAQAFVFFVAGFETSATTMTFALLELAQNPVVQEKLRQEIKQTLKQNENKLTYESLLGMEYLEKVISDMIRKTVDYREKNNVFRKDALHLLIQLKNTGRVLGDDEATLKGDNENVTGSITMNELAAQAFVFFVAGFETSATTMTFALLELAQNPVVQEKLRQEIKQTLKQNDNKLTYESLLGMEYLEKVISETLRMHPPIHRLARLCNKDFNIPNSDLVIKSQTQVLVPVLAIHNDPEYYPNPEKFDPERFSKEAKACRPSMTYFPFGDGPQNCIGQRFGKLQAKLGLCTVVSNFNVTLNEKTKLPIEYDLITVITVKGNFWLNLEPLEK